MASIPAPAKAPALTVCLLTAPLEASASRGPIPSDPILSTPQEWQTPEMKAWREEDICSTLDEAQVGLHGCWGVCQWNRTQPMWDVATPPPMPINAPLDVQRSQKLLTEGAARLMMPVKGQPCRWR